MKAMSRRHIPQAFVLRYNDTDKTSAARGLSKLAVALHNVFCYANQLGRHIQCWILFQQTPCQIGMHVHDPSAITETEDTCAVPEHRPCHTNAVFDVVIEVTATFTCT